MRTQEQLQRHKEKVKECKHKFILCSQQVNVDLFGHQKKTLITPLPLNCHSYYCSKCGYVKRMDFRRRLRLNIKNDSWYFLTLTTWKEKYTTEQALAHINKAWNAFIATIKIKYKNVQYCRVLEISKSNSVHLHVIWNIHVPKTRIKRLWERYHNSYIADVTDTPIKHDDIIAYLSKYVDKDMQETNSNDWYYIHQKRRFSFSRNMEKIAKLKNFKLLEDLVLSTDQVLKLIAENLSGDDWHLSDLCLDYLPPGYKESFIDTFSSYS